MRRPNWEIRRTPEKQIIEPEEELENMNDLESDVVKLLVNNEDNITFLKDILKNVSKSFDLSLFRNIRFLFQGVLTPFMFGCGSIVVFVYMVPYGVEAGVSALKSSFLISVIGICMILTRISPLGWMIDRKIISTPLLGGIPTIFGGITMMVFPFTTTYVQMVLIAIIYGIAANGIGASLYPVMVRDAAGSSKKAAGALAYTNVLYGIGGVSGILLTGRSILHLLFVTFGGIFAFM